MEDQMRGYGFYARIVDFMPIPKPVSLQHGSGFFKTRLTVVANAR
jgi:hypothetical protein